MRGSSSQYIANEPHISPLLTAYKGHDRPPSLPIAASGLSQVLMTVEESVHYPLLGNESDIQWASLSSAGYGYVRLGPENRLFAVTMFHELHCLRMLNYAFGKSRIASIEHVQHCLAYLKDGIICDADLTIEPGNFEERDFESQRTGVTHVCKDWASLYEAMDQNYYGWRDRNALR